PADDYLRVRPREELVGRRQTSRPQGIGTCLESVGQGHRRAQLQPGHQEPAPCRCGPWRSGGTDAGIPRDRAPVEGCAGCAEERIDGGVKREVMERFGEYFDAAFSGLEGIKNLKRLILTLAIQG